MPLKLDDIDIALLKSLIKDGRKSFRQISREIDVSAPTVKTRYERLVNAGLIKAVSPDIDFGKLEIKTSKILEIKKGKEINERYKLDKGILVKLSCDYCKGPVHGKPTILKFANMERFFCCTSCKSLYKEKYKKRIDAMELKFE